MALSQVYFYLYQYKPIFTLLFLNFFKISIGTRENNTNSTLDFFSDSLFFIASKLLKSTSQVKIYIMYAQVHKRVCERESRLMHFSSAFCTFFFLFFFLYLVDVCSGFVKGASTACYVALSQKTKGVSGRYFADCNESHSSGLSNDESEAHKLWKQTRALIHKRMRQSRA